MVNIKGLDKIEVLDALYQASHPQGMGMMHYVPGGLSDEDKVSIATEFDNSGKFPYIDYLNGRVMKVDLNGEEFDERLFDRDCGAGAAHRAIVGLVKK
jgi:hypothetical protein